MNRLTTSREKLDNLIAGHTEKLIMGRDYASTAVGSILTVVTGSFELGKGMVYDPDEIFACVLENQVHEKGFELTLCRDDQPAAKSLLAAKAEAKKAARAAQERRRAAEEKRKAAEERERQREDWIRRGLCPECGGKIGWWRRAVQKQSACVRCSSNA